MLTMMGGNSLCFANESESESPFSTSSRTSTRSSPSRRLSVCSDRIDRQRRIGSPDDSMVANWREKMARSLDLTLPFPNRISMFMPVFVTSTAIGVSPCCRVRDSASDSLAALIFDSTSLPDLARALTRYSVCGIGSLAQELVEF